MYQYMTFVWEFVVCMNMNIFICTSFLPNDYTWDNKHPRVRAYSDVTLQRYVLSTFAG